MPNFGRIVSLAYLRILQRPPDPGGLENFNRLMNDGLTEAMMREALLRSPEYAANNPDPALAAAPTTSKSRKKTSRRKKTTARG